MKPIKFVIISVLLCMGAVALASTAVDGRAGVERSLVEKGTPSINLNGTVIELWSDVAAKFEIFSITGQLIKSVNVPASTLVKVELAKGFYIVKCESWTRRVMVK